MTSLIRDLFRSDVTRDIPPVVYFHEQSPEKLAAEVSEYIITGGWPPEHPNHGRVPKGIHEETVRLLTSIAEELQKPGGPDLPNAWISGFYGSGKSSFAKLLGLSLGGATLPHGAPLAEAWLSRDTSPNAERLRAAWQTLTQRLHQPLAVVFDIGGTARDDEHIHATALRQLQPALGYCAHPVVAEFELRLERDKQWPRFEQAAQQALGKPWAEAKSSQFAEEDFSLILHHLYPDRYTDPMSWFTARAGTHHRSESPEEATAAIRDMLKFRRPDAHLFFVVDEVSQYVLSSKDRVDRLRAFATALGSTLRGKVWLIALGQQKLDEEADHSFLVWAKDRFPPKLRVHLAATNIRDVVHKRLLQKRPDAEPQLRQLFEAHRADLKLYAYGCENVTAEEFVETYPMLPGQIDLILKITTALRTRSTRAQGDDQAIRGLLQLLGELFRDQKLADQPVGRLVTLDQIYEVQHTALDSDVQSSMARILSQCPQPAEALHVRAAKAVALLELIHETEPTHAKLVAQCLYGSLDCGNQVPAVTEALEDLRRRNLLGYSEKHGYKIQSSAGEEWERERRDMGVSRENVSEVVQAALALLLAAPERPRLQGRPFPWAGSYSDGRLAQDASLLDPRDDAALRVDFRFLPREERTESAWIKRSAEASLYNRLLWLCDHTDPMDHCARELGRSRAMVKKYKSRRESLTPARKMLLQQEENRCEDLELRAAEAVATAFMSGKLYFRGRALTPLHAGQAFASCLTAVGHRILPELYPHFISTQVQPSELEQLLELELSGPSPKFLPTELGILELDHGRYTPACSGVVPTRVVQQVESEGGISGSALLAHFGGPPYGYTANVIKACIAGLLRAGRVRVQPDGGGEITSIRDAGAKDLFDKDRNFRRADFFPAREDEITTQGRARICKFFAERLGHPIDRETHLIADAVAHLFPPLAERLRQVHLRLQQLPGAPQGPAALAKLQSALEHCLRNVRQTLPTVKQVQKHLDALADGVELLAIFEAELTPEAIGAVNAAHNLLHFQAAQIDTAHTQAGQIPPTNVTTAAAAIEEHLAAERPWRDIATLQPQLDEIRQCYKAERERLLSWQEAQAEAARSRIKANPRYAKLNSDQSHRVLRPIALAVTNTTADAIAPALTELREPFLQALRRAEDEANELLAEITDVSDGHITVPVELRLRHREVSTEAEVDALIQEIRTRLLEQIAAGHRVRLL